MTDHHGPLREPTGKKNYQTSSRWSHLNASGNRASEGELGNIRVVTQLHTGATFTLQHQQNKLYSIFMQHRLFSTCAITITNLLYHSKNNQNSLTLKQELFFFHLLQILQGWTFYFVSTDFFLFSNINLSASLWGMPPICEVTQSTQPF